MTVAGQITDERLDKVIARLQFEFDGVRTNTAKDILLVLTELQHRREAEAGFREFAKLVDESPHPERSAHLSADGRAQAAFAMLDNFKRQARALAASPSSPASGVRVKVKPLVWVDEKREWPSFAAESVFGTYRLIEERPGVWLVAGAAACRPAKDCPNPDEWLKQWAQRNLETRVRSALGEHP